MGNKSLGDLKRKNVYQFIVLAVTIFTISVGVIVTSDKFRQFSTQTKAAGAPACASWTNFMIGGSVGYCTPYSSYSENLPVCNTVSRSVFLNMSGVSGANQMQLVNVADVSWYCTDSRIVWPSPQSYNPFANWSLTDGLGGKKVCGRFTNDQGEAKCGGMIHLISPNLPASTPIPPASTPRPPASTPRPCTTCSGSGYRCDGKDAYRCIDRCLIYQGSCPSFKSCSASLSGWSCIDVCPDGSYRCNNSGGYEYLQRCLDDRWTNIKTCGSATDECGCKTSPPSCFGVCRGG